MTDSKKTPSALLAMLPLVLLVVMLVVTVRAYGSDSLLGASQVTLLAVSACYAYGSNGCPRTTSHNTYHGTNKAR